jgi:hypothetical protein
MMTYHAIMTGRIDISGPTKIMDISLSSPYYTSIREAETLWFISWIPQKNGAYKFEGTRNVTRTEFAKMIAIPFNGLLFDYVETK